MLRFVPRPSSPPPAAGGGAEQDPPPTPLQDDLSRFERRGDEDDFRHRMVANLAAFAFTVALTAAGIWLAISIADLRKTQDCVLMGRRDCAHITLPQT